MDETAKPISITDLAVIKKLIETACDRGAFRAAEMTTVGTVYDRLAIFLDQVIAQAESEASATQRGEVK
jgi:hypothetical protein